MFDAASTSLRYAQNPSVANSTMAANPKIETIDAYIQKNIAKY